MSPEQLPSCIDSSLPSRLTGKLIFALAFSKKLMSFLLNSYPGELIGQDRESSTFWIKVTVHIGTDLNFEIDIFADYNYTLN